MNTNLGKKAKKKFKKDFFLSWRIMSFWKNYGKYEKVIRDKRKAKRYSTFHKRKKKKLSGVRTKLS